MFHISAFFQSVDPGNAFQAINAVREEILFVNGPDLRVPALMPNVIGRGCLINDITVPDRAQLQSPSLRQLANVDIEPIVNGAVWGNQPKVNFHPYSPVPVMTDEALNVFVQSDPAAPVVHAALVWLADGPQNPVQGNFMSVGFTATIQQVAGVWVNGNITFRQVLPAGNYQVVGMRFRSADAIAARLIFPQQVARPGVPACNLLTDADPLLFRFGQCGVWGQFPNTIPPTLDVLSGVAATQFGVLDLIKV